MNILVQIKRCALGNRLRFTAKANDELESDDLTVDDIREALVNAAAIYKTIRSKNPFTHKREYLYIIRSENLAGLSIYTKGKLMQVGGVDVFYVLVSSKCDE